MFTEVGSDFHTFGLNADQLSSADLDDNLYEEYGMDAAYTKTTDESGNVVYTSLIDTSLDGNAFTAARMAGGLTKTGVGEDIGYSIDRGYSNITEQGTNEWARYESIGAVSTYTDDIMDGEDAVKRDRDQRLELAGLLYMAEFDVCDLPILLAPLAKMSVMMRCICL